MSSFVREFGINWKLLIAQLINFSILVFILAKFVYKPILRALDARRKKIEEGVAFSEKAKEELGKVEVLKAGEMKKAELAAVAVVKQAETSALRVKEGILVEAEQEKEKVILSGKKVLGEEQAKLEKGFYLEAAGIIKEALTKIVGSGQFGKEEDTLIQKTLEEVKMNN